MLHSKPKQKATENTPTRVPRAVILLVQATCRCDGYEHCRPTGQHMRATIVTAESAMQHPVRNTGDQANPPWTQVVEGIANALEMLRHRSVTESPDASSPAFRFLNKDGQEVMTFRPDCDLRAMSQYDGGRRGRHWDRLPNSPLTVLESMALYPQWCLRVLDTHSVIAGTMNNDDFTPSNWQAFSIGGVRDDRVTAYQTWRDDFMTSAGFGDAS